MTYINGASANLQANVGMFESDTFGDNLLAIVALKDIDQGAELLLYYGDTFLLPPPKSSNATHPRPRVFENIGLQPSGTPGAAKCRGQPGGAKWKQTGVGAPSTPPAPQMPQAKRGKKRPNSST